jgi:hypothetical protein
MTPGGGEVLGVVGPQHRTGWDLPKDLKGWGACLVQHFFRKRDDFERPVTLLLVTADELARSLGAPASAAERVRDAFVAMVLRHVRRERGLLEEASEYPEWPEPPPPYEIPRFVPHLFFTCIAASESSDDLEDEESFIRRLRDLSDDRLPDRQLEYLPTLWCNLAKWLATGENRTQYQQLILPDPGGHTRIGFTTRLTFPDRRDQQCLSELLDEARLSGIEPPVPPVLAIAARHRTRFSRRFVDELDAFRRQFEDAPGDPHLSEHRFWAAVCDAALRGRGTEPDLICDARVRMLALPEEESLFVFLASDCEIADHDRLHTKEMRVCYGQWTHAVLTTQGELSADLMATAATAILEGSIKLPRISAMVGQGLLAFAEGVHGALELATGRDLDIARVALVRDDLALELVSALNATSARVRPSAYAGWAQIDDLPFRRLPFSALEEGKLKACWQLYELLPMPTMDVVAGIPADDGWLGFREALPKVTARECRDVTLVAADRTSEKLLKTARETWAFPQRDLVGTFELVADTGTATPFRKAVRFYTSAATDDARRPQDLEAWMVEGVVDCGHLDGDPELAPAEADVDADQFCEHVVYLGREHGEFVGRPEDAAWRVVFCGKDRMIARVRAELCGRPTSQVGDPAARRRWRKFLLRSKPADIATADALRAVGTQFPPLPTLDRPVAVCPSMSAEKYGVDPNPRVDRLVAMIAARGANRSGIGLRDWQTTLTQVLALPPSERWEYVTRAWQESGLIDVSSFARWRATRVFARPPRFVAVRSGTGVRVVLTGLAVETVRARVSQAAQNCGVFVEERRSPSPLVPSTLSAFFPDSDAFHQVLQRTGLQTRWLDLAVRSSLTPPHRSLQDPPLGYDATPWETWSLEPASTPPGVSIIRHTRPDRPNYWLVSADGFRLWTYDRNLARLWACAAVGETPVTTATRELHARHAFLPLPFARVVSALGPGLPGLDPLTSTYRYPFVSEASLKLVSNALRAAFESPRRQRRE